MSNSTTTDDVRDVLLGLAKGAETFADLSGNATASAASRGAAGLIAVVVGLLEHRTQEEARALLEDLVADPARKVDLGSLDGAIAEAIRQRAEAEGAAP